MFVFFMGKPGKRFLGMSMISPTRYVKIKDKDVVVPGPKIHGISIHGFRKNYGYQHGYP